MQDVDWGDIDYLVVDAPPGTSDEHISIAQYLKASQVDGAVIVTTPQEISLLDVRKEINFCKKVSHPCLHEPCVQCTAALAPSGTLSPHIATTKIVRHLQLP